MTTDISKKTIVTIPVTSAEEVEKVYLVTGANIGLGLETVRQLALKKDTKKVYLACRTKSKAMDAIDKLIAQNKDKINISHKLEYIPFDASVGKSTITKSILEHLQPPNGERRIKFDGIILNAGGLGHDTKGMPSGPNDVIDILQINLIGHIHLLNALMENGFMHDVSKEEHQSKGRTTIIFSGSEVARGVHSMFIFAPTLPNTVEEYKAFVDGSLFSDNNNNKKKYNGLKAYAVVKGMGALYFASFAEKHPEYHVLTVSPGGTGGTNVGSHKGFSKVMQLGYHPIVTKIASIFGIMHDVSVGSKRYVDAVTAGDGYNEYKSGTFLASKKGTTGQVDDQTKYFGSRGAVYGNSAYQEAAYGALQLYA